MLVKPAKKSKREPTITLINVVFLMLVFFLIAGTLAPPLDPDLTLVSTDDLDGREPPDAMVITADGKMMYRGDPIDVASYVAKMGQLEQNSDKTVVRIVPDQDLAALRLLEIGRALQMAGADKVFLVTKRSLQ